MLTADLSLAVGKRRDDDARRGEIVNADIDCYDIDDLIDGSDLMEVNLL